MAWPGDRVQQMVIAMTLFEGNLPQKRLRERETARARARASWMPNDMDCRKQGTTGWISLIGFACSVNVHNSICLVYAKFNGLSCMVPGYPFWGPYRFTVFRSPPFLGRSWSYEHEFLRLRRVVICPPLKHPGSQLHLCAKLELWMGKSSENHRWENTLDITLNIMGSDLGIFGIPRCKNPPFFGDHFLTSEVQAEVGWKKREMTRREAVDIVSVTFGGCLLDLVVIDVIDDAKIFDGCRSYRSYRWCEDQTSDQTTTSMVQQLLVQ